jgi:hypothetical protein
MQLAPVRFLAQKRPQMPCMMLQPWMLLQPKLEFQGNKTNLKGNGLLDAMSLGADII